MTERDRFKLLFGPYRPPYVRKGEVVFCDVRGEVVVRGMSSGRIAWPVTRLKRSRLLLIVFAGLAEAIRVPPGWKTAVNTSSVWIRGPPRRYRAPSLARSCADRESQTRTVRSPEAEMSRVPSGLQATAWT